MGVEELGLGLATVGTLAIPPLGAISVNNVARCTRDGNVAAGNGDQRTLPLLVTEAGGALEDDLGAAGELG